ncbi:MAG: EFR1 family ferrodoxin [Eubacteriales bacterium]
MFYPLFVHAKKFYELDTCISCGLCEKVCPPNNIKLIDDKSSRSDKCTHCMACICRCPEKAIEFL